MKTKALLAAALLALATGPALADGVVTIYSADGLHGGDPSWYETEFAAFTKATGIEVRYIEAGSGVVVQRVAKEQSNPQADVLVTLPPFIQKAAADGLLAPYDSPEAQAIPEEERGPNGAYVPLVNNYMNFIYNKEILDSAPKSFEDFLDPKFKGKIQYSTPGQAGDGTAVMLQVFHAFGGKDAGFEYLKKLQENNVGPSSSTGKLAPLVNKGELYIANGDLQMNMSQTEQNPNIQVFWPAGPDGKASTFALPYAIGLVKGAPNAENGKKLIDFLLSKDAQSQLPSIAWGMPVRNDIEAADENFKTMQALLKDVTIWSPDWDKVLQDLEADVARWHKVTGS
jgi:2-aminoethylphosphonate transport system substrate-binding protein